MMKIGQPTDLQLPSSIAALAVPAKGSQSDKRVAGDAPRGTTSGVAVTVSPLARSMTASSQGDTPDVNFEKVEAMKTAISNREFHVNPEAIADKLLSNAQEMLSRQRT
jgi:negative regulator of flagellin synthesis FlgM